MAFSGFDQADFEVFDLPDIGSRMPALKARITPKLRELGDELAPRLSEALGVPVVPHVAQHLRRSVNAPVATWVAFARERRSYKPEVHFRAAISGDEIRCSVFVEDYADEKEAFAANLVRLSGPLASYLKTRPSVLAYTITAKKDEPLRGKALNKAALAAFGERLGRIKGQHAIFGIAWDRSHPVVASGPQMVDALVEAAREMAPLYWLGTDVKKARAAMG